MLSSELIAELFEAAQNCMPYEMCGLLFSENRFVQCGNHADDPQHNFVISHMAYKFWSLRYSQQPWAIVHSHPTKGGTPSVKDCQLMDALEACNQPMDMVIVGLNPVEVRCYRKVEHVYRCEWGHRPAEGVMTLDHVKQISDALLDSGQRPL